MLFNIFILLFTTKIWAMDYCLEEHSAYKRCMTYSYKHTCDMNLIRAYSGNMFRTLNASMRGIKPNPECVKVKELLKAALLTQPKTTATLYRGTALLPELEDLKEGDCFADPSFLSTSLNITIAKNFSKDRALFTIEQQSGRNISEISLMKGEDEVLLLPMTWLQLINREGNHFQFKEVPESECSEKVIAQPNVPPAISISEARYGDRDATQALREKCDGKSFCKGIISHNRLFVKKPKKKDRSFLVKWTCSGKEKNESQTFSLPYAEDEWFEIKCP